MQYRLILTDEQAGIMLIVTVCFFIIIFWLIPMIRWGAERQKKRIISFRAIVSMGKKNGPKIGGSFYRVSAYNDFLIIVMWWPETIKYSDIKNLKLDKSITSNISMLVHGVTIKIYGNIDSLQNLQQIIKSKINGVRHD